MAASTVGAHRSLANSFGGRRGIVVSVCAFVVYAVAIVLGAPRIGAVVAAAAVLPVVVAAFSMGTRAGLISAIIAVPLSNVLLNVVLGGAWDLARGGGLTVGVALLFIGGVVGTLHDLLARVSRLHEELESRNAVAHRLLNLARATLDANDEGMAVVGADGRVEMVNRGFGVIFGVADGVVVQRSLADLRPMIAEAFENADAFFAAVRDAQVGAEPISTILVQRAPHKRELELTCRPIRGPDETLAGRLYSFRDITRQRAMERMKGEFVSIVSHELRTPIASIRGSLGLLAGGVLGTMPPQAQRMLDIATTNSDRMARLIDDILDIERLESNRAPLKKEWCDVAAVMLQATEAVQDSARQAGIQLHVEPLGAQLYADADRLHQLLTNLLANAIKFSDPRGCVRLSGTLADDELVLYVADTGRGIPRDQLEAIFDKFYQGDASDSRRQGGVGLGLAISRAIAAQHGGRITAESAGVNRGSTFVVRLPRTENVDHAARSRRDN